MWARDILTSLVARPRLHWSFLNASLRHSGSKTFRCHLSKPVYKKNKQKRALRLSQSCLNSFVKKIKRPRSTSPLKHQTARPVKFAENFERPMIFEEPNYSYSHNFKAKWNEFTYNSVYTSNIKLISSKIFWLCI